jgi:hypothetical protein
MSRRPVAIKALDDGRVLDTKTFTKRARREMKRVRAASRGVFALDPNARRGAEAQRSKT